MGRMPAWLAGPIRLCGIVGMRAGWKRLRSAEGPSPWISSWDLVQRSYTLATPGGIRKKCEIPSE